MSHGIARKRFGTIAIANSSDVMETNKPNIDFNNGNQRAQSSNDSLQIQSLGEFKEPESGIEFPDFNFQEKLKNLIREQAEILSGSTLAQ